MTGFHIVFYKSQIDGHDKKKKGNDLWNVPDIVDVTKSKKSLRRKEPIVF